MPAPHSLRDTHRPRPRSVFPMPAHNYTLANLDACPHCIAIESEQSLAWALEEMTPTERIAMRWRGAQYSIRRVVETANPWAPPF